MRKFYTQQQNNIRDCMFVLAAIACAALMIWLAVWIAHVIADRDQMRADQQAEAQAYKVAYEGDKWRDDQRKAYIAAVMKTPWKAAILRSK